MMFFWLLSIIIPTTVLLVVDGKDVRIEEEQDEARNFLLHLNRQTEIDANRLTHANWAYASNLTEHNLNLELDVAKSVARNEKEAWQRVIQFNWQQFPDATLKRQFKKYALLGTAALTEPKLIELNRIVSDMEAIYSKATVCNQPRTNCHLSLEPDLSNILATSRNETELKHVWLEWRNVIGPKCRQLYTRYVNLSNEAAQLNNFTTNGDAWLADYEDPQFKSEVARLWQQLRPLYLELHAYVRQRLRVKYGPDVVSARGPIPAHLLGNMWAQSWNNIADDILPYPEVRGVNLTEQLIVNNYTVEKIFRTAEEFFTSLNLTAMPEQFWNRSILVKPTDRAIICHASAWDFYDGHDYRIKQCTEITEEQFIVAHHEMGHIEYFLQYRHLPVKFRDGANDGFHEAIGDLIALSVRSTRHLKRLGLVPPNTDDNDDDTRTIINDLFRQGMAKITFLPFGYLMDRWRWDVFAGSTTDQDYTCKWWELREQIQGVEPPVDRTEEDFDPASKYHIIANVPYLRYFISFVLQFQLHRSLCQYQTAHQSELSQCDIYGSHGAGEALKRLLQLGSSRPWPDALETVTGQRQLDATAILEFFQPLREWLQMENRRSGVPVGWEPSKRVCTRTRGELSSSSSTTEGTT